MTKKPAGLVNELVKCLDSYIPDFGMTLNGSECHPCLALFCIEVPLQKSCVVGQLMTSKLHTI